MIKQEKKLQKKIEDQKNEIIKLKRENNHLNQLLNNIDKNIKK